MGNPSNSEVPARQINPQLSQQGLEKPFVSATTLVKDELQHHLPVDDPVTPVSYMSALARPTNRISLTSPCTTKRP